MEALRGLSVGVGLITAVVITAVLYIGSFVFAPVAFALFIIAIVWPLQEYLQRRVPKLLALAIVIVTTICVFLAFAALAAWSFGRAGQWLVSNAARFQALYDQGTAWIESWGIVTSAIWSEHFTVGWLMRAIQRLAGRANTTATFWLIVLLYVMLGLLEVESFGRKLKAMENRAVALMVLDGARATAGKFRAYMVARTLMSVMTGALVWAFGVAFGLPLALEWGVIAFVLNYIPFIGPFIATILPTLFALVQFGSWESALVVFICLNVIQFVVGSYIEPRVAGTMLDMSPFLVLFLVFLWTFLWGISGTFIGVPIGIAVLSFCAQHPSSRWLAVLFGGAGAQPEIKTPG
jgi:predicted PurR-regulated permease PerM